MSAVFAAPFSDAGADIVVILMYEVEDEMKMSLVLSKMKEL